MHWWDGWGWGHMLGMGLFWTLLLLAAVALVVWLVRSGSRGPAPGRPGAEDVLRERYARGEIDDEEYRYRLAELRHG